MSSVYIRRDTSAVVCPHCDNTIQLHVSVDPDDDIRLALARIESRVNALMAELTRQPLTRQGESKIIGGNDSR